MFPHATEYGMHRSVKRFVNQNGCQSHCSHEARWPESPLVRIPVSQNPCWTEGSLLRRDTQKTR